MLCHNRMVHWHNLLTEVVVFSSLFFSLGVWSLSEDWGGQNWRMRTRNRPELDWDWGHTWSIVEVDKQPISMLLSNLLGNYKFTLPRTQVLCALHGHDDNLLGRSVRAIKDQMFLKAMLSEV